MATISVLLLTSDIDYSHRLRNYMASRHPDIKLCIISEPAQFSAALSANACFVALIGAEFADNELFIPEGIGSALLTDKNMGEEYKGRKAFCKYSSGEAVYKHILSIYSEVSGYSKRSEEGIRTYAFFGAGGGSGCTTVSAAFARRLAMAGKKVAYLSLDRYSDMTQWFDGERGGDLSDLIFAVISAQKKNTNLAAKAASLLSRDPSGVYYLLGCKNAFDYGELDESRAKAVYTAISSADSFDAVVLDGSFGDKIYRLLVEEKADRMYVVSANDVCANAKLRRFIEDIRISDARAKNGNKASIGEKLSIVMNRTAAFNGAGGTYEGVKLLGCIPKYNDTPKHIVETASQLELWLPAVQGR